MFKQLALFCIVFSIANAQAVKLPVFIVPGLGDSCNNPISMMSVIHQMQMKVSNPIFCVDAAPFLASYVNNYMKEITKACGIMNDYAKKIDIRNGFIMMGFSQGGLTARAVVEHCAVGAYAKKLITLGGVHQGVAAVPNTMKDFWGNLVNGAVDKVIYTSVVQNTVGPAGYFHVIDDGEVAYKASYCPLAMLNNVCGVKNSQYKDRIQNLEELVLVMFGADTMLIPKETAHFGFYADHTRTTLVSLEDSDIVKEDTLGLKKLVDEKKVFKYVFAGREHMQFDMNDLATSVFPHF